MESVKFANHDNPVYGTTTAGTDVGLGEVDLKVADFWFKLLIIGDSGVGKSSLVTRYADNEYSDQYIPTVPIDFVIRTIETDGKLIKLIMWDTAGQERFRTITSTFYRGAHGAVLVFDLTDAESFHNVKGWLDTVDKFGGGHVAKLLVGNKCDMEDKRAVTYEMAQELADSLEISYLETSARISTNVEQAFLTMATEMKQRFETRASQTHNPIVLTKGKDVGGHKRSIWNKMCSC